VSIAAFGEGWHNFHHAYPYDYACAEHGILFAWNPTKFFIDSMLFLGLASNPKRAKTVAKGMRLKNMEKAGKAH